MVIEGQRDMGDRLLTEENQVAGAHLGPLDGVIEKAILLVAVARNKIAAGAVAKLDKAAAIQASPTGTTPEVLHAEKLARISQQSRNGLAGIWLVALAQFY